MWGTRWYLNCKHNQSSRRFANLEHSTYNDKTAIGHIFSENRVFLKIMKKDLVSSETITYIAKQRKNV